MSAARAAPLAPTGEPARLLDRVKSEATNFALNALAVARETWADFRSSSRFFKYKAAIVATWVALSVTTFVIARPGTPGTHVVENELSARIVVAKSGERTVYMLQNESDEGWTNVVLTANEVYSATVKALPARKDFAFTPEKFLGPDGTPAPLGFVARELTLSTDQGSAQLIEDGELAR